MFHAPPPIRTPRPLGPICCVLLALAAVATASMSCAQRSGGPTDLEVRRGLDRTDRYLQRQRVAGPQSSVASSSDRPIAIVDGQPLQFGRLQAPLLDATGAMILEEVILDMLLERELDRLNIDVDKEAREAEQQRLLSSLTRNALALTERDALALLNELRARRGLGASRYPALLQRNASLRALVRDRVTISPADLDQAFQLRYGPKFRARIITTTTVSAAQQALSRLRADEPFAQVAADISTDPSRDRGGLLPPISLADTSFPSSIRTALRNLEPGERSVPIALDASYAIVMLDAIIPPPVGAPASIDDVRDELERDTRLYQERVLMDDLARRLLDGAHVSILNPALDRSWRQRRNVSASP